ncbi:MAG: type III-B CRISPR module RAMP protein Cmr4 [Spirulinaceae cyanobacterium]
MFKQARLLFLYTETPLHVGSGSSLGTVDLPIQRESHTNFPMIQSTGIKGKLRNVFENNGLGNDVDVVKVVNAIFGSESSNAGALSPGDGRLLLFPVRSLAGVFAWITCPFVISRLQRDLAICKNREQGTGNGKQEEDTVQNMRISEPESNQAYVPKGSKLIIDKAIVLEEFSFEVQSNHNGIKALAEWLAENALPQSNEYEFWRNKLKKDLVVVSDDTFKDFCKFSTDVVSRIKLNTETKIAEKGALWTEENLPADALLYTPLFACNPRQDKVIKIENKELNAELILELMENNFSGKRLQLGGNETVGRGIVATRMMGKKEDKTNG